MKIKSQAGLPALLRNPLATIRARALQAGLPAIAMRRHLQAGQTLIEILIALSISILVLSSIVVGITTSLSNAQYTKNQNLANSYAQEGIDVVREIRDSSLSKFKSYLTNTTYCLAQSSTELVLASAPPLTCGQFPVGQIFYREINFEQNSAECSSGTKITVKVSWADNKCPIGTPLCHNVQLVSCFSNVDQKQSP